MKLKMNGLNCFLLLCAIKLTSIAQPAVNLGNDTSLCDGATLVLDAGNMGASYLWQDNSSNQTLLVSASGTYWVDVTNGMGTTRDTIVISAYNSASFGVPDTTVCGGIHTLAVLGDTAGYDYLWWDAAVGGNLIGMGDALAVELYDTTTYYIEGANVVRSNFYSGLVDYASTNYGSRSNFYDIANSSSPVRGLAFEVLKGFLWKSVNIPTNGSVSGDIVLYKNNVEFQRKRIELATGDNQIKLGWQLTESTGYEVLLENLQGGELYVDWPLSASAYPSNAYVVITNGVPIRGHYNFLYDWECLELACFTSRQASRVNVLPTPVLAFPQDTLLCSNEVTLDASSSGADDYLWSNGTTSSSVTLSQSDTIHLRASRGICSDSMSIAVLLLDTARFSVRDSTVCGGAIVLSVQGSTQHEYLWWDAATGGNLIGIGDTITVELHDTTTYYIEGASEARRFYSGLVDYTSTNYGSSNFYSVATTSRPIRGLSFEVNQDFLWKTVTVPANGYAQGDVVLYSGGIEVYRSSVEFFAGLNLIPLDWYLTVGSNYEVVIDKLQGSGELFIDLPLSTNQYPSNQYVTITNGIPLRGHYNFFYDWECVELACPTARQVMSVNILPTPSLDLPTDTIICGTTHTIDVTENNASYLWSDNTTNPTLTVDRNQTIRVTVTIGACTVEDSTEFFFTQPPLSLSPPSDTTTCGGTITMSASGNAYTYLWYDTELATTPIGAGDSLVYNAVDSSQIWVEGVNFIEASETYGELTNQPLTGGTYENPNGGGYSTRGIKFDVLNSSAIILNGFTMHTDAPVTATIQLRNSLGQTLYDSTLVMMTGQNDIVVDWLIEQGSAYELVLMDASGGNIYARDLGSAANMLKTYTDFVIQSTVPSILGRFYYYFFDWKISTPSCPTSRSSVKINVLPKPDLDLVSDTAVCGVDTINLEATSNAISNYSYVWSEGSTTRAIGVTASGHYVVTVLYDSLCETTKDIFVQLLDVPAPIHAPDLRICSSQELSLLANPTDAILSWKDSVGRSVHLSAPYNLFVDSSQLFYPQAHAKSTTRVGMREASDEAIYLNVITGNTFDVYEHTVLDSVAMYVEEAPQTFDLMLLDARGTVLETRTVSINSAKSKEFLPLDFVIPPGTGYNLIIANPSNSLKFLVDFNAPLPLTTSSQIASLTGSSLGFNYMNFFDWHFSYAYPGCQSSPDTFEVNVVLPLVLEDSVHVCDSLVLDVSSASASSYSWSTGAVTPVVTLTTPGIYSVTVSDNASCVGVDTLILSKPSGVGFPVDGKVCQGLLTTAYEGTGASFRWNTGDTTEYITGVQAGSTYSVTVTLPSTCQVSDHVTITQLTAPPAVDLTPLGQSELNGCESVEMDAGFGGLGYTYEWSTGDTGQIIRVNQNGFYSVTVTTPTACVGSDGVTVDLLDYPVALFEHRILLPNGPIVNFTNQSTHASFYTWYMGDTLNVNTTFAPDFAFPTDSCYYVTLIASNTCGVDTFSTWVLVNADSSFCVRDTSNPVQQLREAELDWVVYPNPNRGTFFLLNKNQVYWDTAILNIVNLQGERVHQKILDSSQKQWLIELENLPTGVYLVYIHQPQGNFTQKLLILNR